MAPALPAFPHSRGAPALRSFLWPPLAPLQQGQVCPVLRAPELDAGLPVGSHQSGAEGQNPLPCPAAHAARDAAQGTVGLLACERTLPGHADLLVNQQPQVLLLRAALNLSSTQPVSVLAIAPTPFSLLIGTKTSIAFCNEPCAHLLLWGPQTGPIACQPPSPSAFLPLLSSPVPPALLLPW